MLYCQESGARKVENESFSVKYYLRGLKTHDIISVFQYFRCVKRKEYF